MLLRSVLSPHHLRALAALHSLPSLTLSAPDMSASLLLPKHAKHTSHLKALHLLFLHPRIFFLQNLFDSLLPLL